ncbi:MAG: M20/M25/M40 family metallo-hydrolase [Candidatus Roizmanbacteria bacterium]
MEKIADLARTHNIAISAFCDPCPAGYTDPSDKLVQTALSLIPNARLTVSQGAADLGFFTARGIKSIINGPGNMDLAHQPDEYCEIDQVVQAVPNYEAIINGWSR